MSLFNLFTKNQQNANVYDNLTHKQKLAAMNLMMVFGGSCSGTDYELNKINHIMTVEGQLMGISENEMKAASSHFDGMEDMVNALFGADHQALEKLFWAFYCIIAVGKSEYAAYVLLGIYHNFGFAEQDCLNILETRTGIKF